VRLPRLQPEVYPDDSLKQRAFGRAPATRHVQNVISRLIHEQYEPGMCWYLDLGPVHVSDFEGNRFSRLGVDDSTGYALLSVAESAGSSSLVGQLDDITSLSCQRAGRNPCVFRMDFGAEAAVQGRGDRCITAALVAWMDAHPGCRIVPNGPYAPGWNRAENAWQRVHGMSYINHQRAHLGAGAWSIMERCAVWQYNRQAARDGPEQGVSHRTRLTFLKEMYYSN
jgi:hypothetical protein